MREMSIGGTLRSAAGFALTAVLASAAFGADYIQADAKISGKQIHAFSHQGRNVTVVLGDFSLTVGQRKITGRDAVLWVKTDSKGLVERHDIVVYVEGRARVEEPGGSSLTDRVMILTVHNAGRLSASGILTERPLKDFPLYKRAVEAREKHEAGGSAPAKPARHAAPKLVIGKQPTTRRRLPTPTTRGAAAAEGTPRQRPKISPPTRPASPRPSRSQDTDPVKVAHPVSFHADRITHELNETKGRWETVARGNVYLSQGDPESARFIEMRSQEAVIFSQEGGKDIRDARSPYSPKLRGIGDGKLAITGVYLEGDVIIARGERYFRGPSAFYDFTTDRAIIIDPVFRTVLAQRNIPIYIRASEARVLSARELWFADAKVSTSDFYTPTYHMGAGTAYVMDTTPYDDQGEPLGEQSWHTKMKNVTFNIRGVPVLWSPITQGDMKQGNTALRTISVGRSGDFGWGVQSEWHLFRLLGLIKPEGYKGKLELDVMERGFTGGLKLDYTRRNYSGYHRLYAVIDDDQEDDFGTERRNIEAARQRGRVLMRHKQFLPNDWQLQFELSYYCDRNFIEEYFRNEFRAGKEQETLFYAKKQTDNWAFTALMKNRLNRFQSQPESAPDLGLYLIGEPLAGDRLTFFHESHAGIKRFKWDDDLRGVDNSSWMVRLDTRDEIDFPIHLGPVNIVPYAVGRATHWGDDFDENAIDGVNGEKSRLYGQVGVRANTHIWAVYDNAESRLWDVHRLKHIITPEATGWLASSHGVYPEDLYPMNPDIEEHLERTSGVAIGLRQRLQTKRGPAGSRRTVDWMRLNLSLGIYDNHRDTVPSDGRFFAYRPEYSLARNHLNGEYFWHISDSTLLLADGNYDLDSDRLARGNVGLALERNPRLRYYTGLRYIDDINSTVGTLGVNYKISRKYSISAFEQYDFAFQNGRNLVTSVRITRKLPRWYVAFSFSYSTTDDDLIMMISFWPERIGEVRLGTGKLSVLGRSDEN